MICEFYGKNYSSDYLSIPGLVVGSLLQLVLPFLPQSIVGVGIKNQDIGFIYGRCYKGSLLQLYVSVPTVQEFRLVRRLTQRLLLAIRLFGGEQEERVNKP